MDELTRLAAILDGLVERLDQFAAQLRAGELVADLRQHPDLAYLDAQLDGFYDLDELDRLDADRIS